MKPLFAVYLWILGPHLWKHGAVVAAENRCKQKKSEYGIVLLGSTYKNIPAANLMACLQLCDQDEKCYSANFGLMELVCELNSHTRFTRSQQVTHKPMSIYMESTERDLAVYKPVGCFKKPSGNNMKLVTSFRETWRSPLNLWVMLHLVVDACMTEVKERFPEMTHFGIEFWGECWAGIDAELTYKQMTKSDDCYYEDGLGMANTIYVYEFN